MKDITQFHHWGFAEWLDDACKEQKNQTINIKVFYDDIEEYYWIDIHNEHDLDEFNVLESFYYIDIPEIQHDIAEAMNQMPIFINLIRQDQ